MKRFFAVFLSVLMIASCFTACDLTSDRGNVSTARDGTVNGRNSSMPDMSDKENLMPDMDLPDTMGEGGTGMIGNR